MAVPETPPMTALNNVQAAAAAENSAIVSNYNIYRPLHKAILQGDWKTAKNFFDTDAGALTAKFTPNGMNALQVAAAGGQWRIVKKLVQKMPPEALAAKDSAGCTALHYVSMGGSVKAAKALVRKNPSLTDITDSEGRIPFLLAITSCSNEKLVRYLALASTDNSTACPFSNSSVGYLVAALTAAGYHDITFYLVERYPELATVSDENGNCILYALSKMRLAFRLKLWERWIYPCIRPAALRPSQTRGDVEDPHRESTNHQCSFASLFWKAIEELVQYVKPRHTLKYQSAVRLVEYVCSKALTKDDLEFWQSFGASNILLNAASCGNVEIIRICSKFFPYLVWNYIPNEGYMIQVAIKNRQEKVFNLLCQMPICNRFVQVVDESHSTTSHLAAKVSPSSQLKCPALQLQKDLQWFKAVERLDHPSHKEAKNADGKIPWQLFREEHKDMLEQAEKWMKKTSASCMLVAALIATVAFTASTTIPGGIETGRPVLLRNSHFTEFTASDTLAMFSAVFSLMTFLSLLIAPYSEEDFLLALPQRLILGVAALLFSLLSTMVAFAIAMSFLFKSSSVWSFFLIVSLAILPLYLCRMLHLPLILKMAKSTYWPGIYSRQFVKRSKFILLGSCFQKVWECFIFIVIVIVIIIIIVAIIDIAII